MQTKLQEKERKIGKNKEGREEGRKKGREGREDRLWLWFFLQFLPSVHKSLHSIHSTIKKGGGETEEIPLHCQTAKLALSIETNVSFHLFISYSPSPRSVAFLCVLSGIRGHLGFSLVPWALLSVEWSPGSRLLPLLCPAVARPFHCTGDSAQVESNVSQWVLIWV